jgi:gamma-glutamyltranspeptidase / glutathione hydrolase
MTSFPHGHSAGSHRPAAMGRKGMVCSGHYLASLAGMRALLAGGNAVDAALATAAALGLVEPHMSGPGGDGYLMVHWKGAGGEREGVTCIDGTGRAPSLAARELFLDEGIPYKGIRSVSVPGLVAGWCLAHERFGSLPLEQVFAPAVELAQDGFPVSPKLAAALAAEAEGESPLFRHPPSAAVFAPEGRPLRAGETLRNPGYALTLAGIARGGAPAFYEGEPARALLQLSESMGGCFTPADLAAHRAYATEPIRTDYRGYTVYEFPPPSSGHVLLQELNLVERFDLRALGWNSAPAIHLMVEAKKLAFADREHYVADPERLRIPLKGLLSKAYAAERAAAIDPQRAAPPPPAGAAEKHEDTTCFCTADRWGNAVCQLQSIQSAFGSGLIAGETGVLLNNRMTYWHLEPDHPNALAPGKRVRHTMNPVMVFAGADRILVCGTPGADTQVQTNLQVLTHLLDFGLDPQEAVEAPRWRHVGDNTESEFPHRSPERLLLEERFDPETRAALAALGHPVETIGAWAAMGSEQVIQQDARAGIILGGSDPRRDGCALAW